ncbi:MAG: carboxypeptidase-like regulatory domain-containing protein [Gemmatimonadota bacterium]|nr:carboxypeptidase-like regulatory domain-containing protein [Gemmatimonadota bacterium]
MFDSLHNAPLAEAQIVLEGRGNERTQTDAGGRFLFEFVVPGQYRVFLGHPLADSLGLLVASPTFKASIGRDIHVELAIPSIESIHAATCPGQRYDSALTLLVAKVSDASTLQPVPNIIARVSTAQAPVQATQSRSGEIKSDSFGRFAICGLPHGLSTVELFDDDSRVGSIPIETGNSRLLITGMVVNRKGAVAGQRGAAVVGDVLVLGGGRGSFASIFVDDSVRATVADSAGQFQVRNIEPGSHSVRARLMGYGSQEMKVIVPASGVVSIKLALYPIAPMLPPIVVASDERRRILDAVGFTNRQLHSGGHFLSFEQIEKSNGFHFSELLRIIPGLNVGVDKFGDDVITSSRAGGSVLNDTHGCVQFVIDGVPWGLGSTLRSSGDPVTSAPGKQSGVGDPRRTVDNIARQQLKDLDGSIQKAVLLGIEVYQGPNTPAQYNQGGGNCATVLVWTQASAK